jgi:hypothetical protein
MLGLFYKGVSERQLLEQKAFGKRKMFCKIYAGDATGIRCQAFCSGPG